MVEPLRLLAHSDVCHFKLCVLVLGDQMQLSVTSPASESLNAKKEKWQPAFPFWFSIIDTSVVLMATSDCCFTGLLSAQSENVPAAKWIIPAKHAAELTATVRMFGSARNSRNHHVRTRLWVKFSSIFKHFYESCLRSSNNTQCCQYFTLS